MAIKGRREIGTWGRRLSVQIASLVACNGYFWSRPGKYLCIPVLQCYACPIGTVACPIGTLSAFMLLRRIPFYAIGLLGTIGLAMGRAMCGWACPFGLLQDALYRVRSPKWNLPRIADGLKYVLLVMLVLAFPLILGGGDKKGAADRITGEGSATYDYCSLICPAGTLEGGVPSLARSPELRAKVSWRTESKIAIAVAVLGLVVVSRRGFCRALCPLGAIMALFSRLSLLQLKTDAVVCTRCMRCVAVCPTRARHLPSPAVPTEATAECVLCLDCVRNCPEKGALSACFAGRTVSISRGKDE